MSLAAGDSLELLVFPEFVAKLTLEIPGGQFDPSLVFSNVLQNPWNFSEETSNPRGFNLWSFDDRISFGSQPYPKLLEKYKKPYLTFS